MPKTSSIRSAVSTEHRQNTRRADKHRPMAIVPWMHRAVKIEIHRALANSGIGLRYMEVSWTL